MTWWAHRALPPAQLLEYFYPECCVKIYIVNAPYAFQVLWKIVKPWLHPVTRSCVGPSQRPHLPGGTGDTEGPRQPSG